MSRKGQDKLRTLLSNCSLFQGGGEPVKKLCDINPLIVKTAKFVTSGAKTRCKFQLADNLWTAEIDSGQIDQVISNIVINADQAMPDGGIITIKSENIVIESDNVFHLPGGDFIKISIKDQGIGIPEKHLAKIFDPYFTTKHKGSGLGLATAYSIIKKHGGHLEVSSVPAKGTCFDIYLPTSLDRIIENKSHDEIKHQGHGKILIMDDQVSILKMIERMLNLMGYETETALDGAKAIEMYDSAYKKGSPFDIVILDLTVPGGIGGSRTVTELLKIDPDVKAVVSSGYSNDPIMANFQNYGFCGVIPKPFTNEHLADLLNKILG